MADHSQYLVWRAVKANITRLVKHNIQAPSYNPKSSYCNTPSEF